MDIAQRFRNSVMTDLDPKKLSFCYSCLNDDQSVQCYSTNGPLQKLMGYRIPLCRYCKEVAENAEKFIANIKCNQTWIKKPFVTKELLTKHITQYQEKLYLFAPKVSEIGTQTAGEVLNNECENDEAKIKQETIEEDEFNNECMDEDFSNEPLKEKDETDDDYTLMKLKQTLGLHGVQIKKVENEISKEKKRPKRTCATTQKKKKKITAKETTVSISMDKDENVKNTADRSKKYPGHPGVETIRLTTEQVKKAIQDKTQSVNYINSVLKCTNCVKGFKYKEKFDKHMEKHDLKSGPYKCEFCSQRFQSHETLRNHTRGHSSRYKCKVCGKIGPCSSVIQDHYESNHSSELRFLKSYPCQLCTKSCKSKRSLYVHMRYTHKEDDNVQCQHCQKKFKRKESLERHIFSVHQKTDPSNTLAKTNVCEQCGRNFLTASMLKTHLLKHLPNKQYYCVECDKYFRYQSSLDTHLKTTRKHIGNNVLPYACGECNQRFLSKRVLTRHINIAHLKIKPYKCEQCKATFSDPWYLKKHIKNLHSGYDPPRIFQCTMCDKSFKLKYVLQGHVRTHTGERPYSCSQCPATFCQSSSLGTHYKLIHLRLNRDGKPKDNHLRSK